MGGQGILPGREQEALRIWASLRQRAEQQDVAAAEDLCLLSILIAQQPQYLQDLSFSRAIAESVLDVAVLPRQRQEQIGRLSRTALAVGDLATARAFFGFMHPAPAELEADSEYRVTAAALATADRNPAQVLTLLGPQKDTVPIADTFDNLASVFRANAYELMGNIPAASQILRELSSPEVLQGAQSRFALLQLCPQSAAVYTQVANREGAAKAQASASGVGCLFGGIFGLSGLIMMAVSAHFLVTLDFDISTHAGTGIVIPGGLGFVFFIIGAFAAIAARRAGKRAAWLRVHGIRVRGRVVGMAPTGTRINNVPVMRIELQVQGPQGPYAASFSKLMHPFQAAQLMGQELALRADPNKLVDIVVEE